MKALQRLSRPDAQTWRSGVVLLVILLIAGSAAGADQNQRLQRLQDLRDFVDRGALIDESRATEVRLGHQSVSISEIEAHRGQTLESSGSPMTTESDWTPYAGPFGMSEAAHLLHRTMIGPKFPEFGAAVGRGLDGEVGYLLGPRLPVPPPGDWATEPFPDTSEWTPAMIDSLISLYFERGDLLRLWWSEAILDQPNESLIETMTLFWHDHFATGMSDVLLPQSMYIQNDLLRTSALGNFKDLVLEITTDPAMLIWLDGNSNRVGNVNENFARELLELFTLGLDQYTQDDVVAAARAFTGYATFDGVTWVFIPEWHDFGSKTFLGQTGAWDGPDIIDIIFEQDETARFICRKLYRWFIDEYPDELLIEDLATTLRTNNYEIAPVLERLLMSEHFFDVNFRGSIICDGIDQSIGLTRSLYISDPDWSHPDNPPAVWLVYMMFVQDHILFEPPNVAGWPGYRSWVNSYTLPWRKSLDSALIDGHVFGYDIEMQADVMALANLLTDPHDPYQLIDDIALYFFGLEPTELVRQRMLDELLQGSEPWEWDLGDPEAESRIQGLIRLAMRLPDFQLK